ncbi:MAG: TolC family protein [Candidatus Omnitrophica bacterium]|nr:TolC family protein [Candidatus Omnitrophota bacterium]
MRCVKTILIWVFIFLYGCAEISAEAATVSAEEMFAQEDLQNRAEKIVAQLKSTEKKYRKKISENLSKARRKLSEKKFKEAREYVKKAYEAKEEGRKIIEGKIRKLAEVEARQRIFLGIGTRKEFVSKDRKYKDMDKTIPSLEENREIIEELLVDIEDQKGMYEIEKKKELEEAKSAVIERKQAEIRGEKEEKLRHQAEEIALYIQKAKEELKRNRFDEAKKYVKKARAVSERAKDEEKEDVKKAEVERKQFIGSWGRKTHEVIGEEKQKKKVEKYLELAHRYLGNNRFGDARRCVEKVKNIDKYNESAEEMILRIDVEEQKFILSRRQRDLAKEDKKREAKEKRRRKETAKELTKHMREVEKRIEKAEGFLKKAQERLDNNKFDDAREYAKKASALDVVNSEARLLEFSANAAEKRYKEEKQRALEEEKSLARKKEIAREKEAEKRREEVEVAKRDKKEAKIKREKAKKIDRYFDKALGDLNKNRFDNAKEYVKKILELDATNREVLELDHEIDKEEEEYKKRQREEEKERFAAELKKSEKEERSLRKKDVEREMARAEAAEKRRKEAEAKIERAKIKKMDRYLVKTRGYLEKNRFDNAKKYVKKTLELDMTNREALELDRRIDREEEEYEKQKREKEKERLASKLEKSKKKEKSLGKRDDEKEMIRVEAAEKRGKKVEAEIEREKSEKIDRYLDKTRGYLKSNKFGDAKKYVKKVLGLDRVNAEAQELFKKIGLAEKEYKQFAEKERNEKRAMKKESRRRQRREKKAEIEKAEKDIRAKKNELKAGKYADKAQKYFIEKDMEKARKYAYMARDVMPDNIKAITLITDINREEMFGARDTSKDENERKFKEATDKIRLKEDPMKKYDEGKSWTQLVLEVFSPKISGEKGVVQEGRMYTIDECVQMALRRSQRIRAAEEQIKLAEMRLWEARRNLLPTVTGRIERSFGKIGVGDEGVTRHYEGEKYTVDLKHNLFDGMGLWYTVRRAQTNQEIVKLEKGKVEEEIVESVKIAYYNLDKARKAVVIQKQYQGQVNKMYGFVEEAYDQELVPRVEYLKVKGQNMQGNFHYDSSIEDEKLAKMILFQAMDINPDLSIGIKPVDRPKNKLVIGLENCYTLTLVNRSDLRIKEATIEYYELERKIMKAKGWPKIDFQGSFGKAFENYQPMRDDGDTDTQKNRVLEPEWYAGIKGSVPLWGSTLEYNYVKESWAPTVSSFRGTETATSYLSFGLLDNLAYFTDLQEVRAGFENAKEEYLTAKENMRTEVKEAYFKYKKALLQIDVAEAQVEHQRMFVDVLEERRKFGEMEVSRVVEEYEKLTEHEYGLVQGDIAYFIALAGLNKAIGIPDHFKPQYENNEYEEWKKNGKILDYEDRGDWETAENKVKGTTIKKRASERKKDIKRGIKGEAKVREKKPKKIIIDKKKERAAKSAKARKDKEEEDAQKLMKKINMHLAKGRASLNEKNFNKAREYAKKALKLSKDQREALELLKNIDKEENMYLKKNKK